jgi:hypothetical protein
MFMLDLDPTERFMWPRFLSRLRDTFSLDSEPTTNDHVITSLQAVSLFSETLFLRTGKISNTLLASPSNATSAASRATEAA